MSADQTRLEVPPTVRQRIEDEVAMWVDLLLGHSEAESAHHRVTRRAELFVRVGGLPLSRVLDALGTDEAGWERRLGELREHEEHNRSSYESARHADAV